MAVARTLLLFSTLFSVFFYIHCDDFKEELFIKPLPPTHLYAYFQFVTVVNDDTSSCKSSSTIKYH